MTGRDPAVWTLGALSRACPRVPSRPRMYPFRTRETLAPRLGRQQKDPFAGFLTKPSDGLEPSTPSLPFRFRGGKGGHERVTATTKAPQTGRIRRRYIAREWTRMVGLVFASRSHATSHAQLRASPLRAAKGGRPGCTSRSSTAGAHSRRRRLEFAFDRYEAIRGAIPRRLRSDPTTRSTGRKTRCTSCGGSRGDGNRGRLCL